MRRPRLLAIRWTLARLIAPEPIQPAPKPYLRAPIDWGQFAGEVNATATNGHITFTGSGWKNGPQG